jgi:hypothetical protein
MKILNISLQAFQGLLQSISILNHDINHTPINDQVGDGEYGGEYIEDNKHTIKPSKDTWSLGINLKIIVSKTQLVFMGHMLRLNVTSTPPLISLLKSESVQEDRENLVCVGRLARLPRNQCSKSWIKETGLRA